MVVLRNVGDTQAAASDEFSIIGILGSIQDLEEGRFAGSVGADQPYTITFGQLKPDGPEEVV